MYFSFSVGILLDLSWNSFVVNMYHKRKFSRGKFFTNCPKLASSKVNIFHAAIQVFMGKSFVGFALIMGVLDT